MVGGRGHCGRGKRNRKALRAEHQKLVAQHVTDDGGGWARQGGGNRAGHMGVVLKWAEPLWAGQRNRKALWAGLQELEAQHVTGGAWGRGMAGNWAGHIGRGIGVGRVIVGGAKK